MSETSFTLHGEKLAQISSPHSCSSLPPHYIPYAYKVFMRKVMRHYAIKFHVELLLHILVNIFHLGALFANRVKSKDLIVKIL